MSREIVLTRNMVAVVDDDDYEILSQWKWSASSRQRHTYYAVRAAPMIEGMRDETENRWLGSFRIGGNR